MIFGWEEVKDNVFGNSTKELLQKEDWVVSSYGAFPIKISSPDALIRNDSKTGQLFSLQDLEDPFSLTINTKPINKEDDIQLPVEYCNPIAIDLMKISPTTYSVYLSLE